MNLGKTISLPEPPAIAKPSKKVSYPSLSLSDSTADDFIKKRKPKLGDTLTVTAKLKVKELSLNDYGNRVTFDVLDLSSGKDMSVFEDKE